MCFLSRKCTSNGTQTHTSGFASFADSVYAINFLNITCVTQTWYIVVHLQYAHSFHYTLIYLFHNFFVVVVVLVRLCVCVAVVLVRSAETHITLCCVFDFSCMCDIRLWWRRRRSHRKEHIFPLEPRKKRNDFKLKYEKEWCTYALALTDRQTQRGRETKGRPNDNHLADARRDKKIINIWVFQH